MTHVDVSQQNPRDRDQSPGLASGSRGLSPVGPCGDKALLRRTQQSATAAERRPKFSAEESLEFRGYAIGDEQVHRHAQAGSRFRARACMQRGAALVAAFVRNGSSSAGPPTPTRWLVCSSSGSASDDPASAHGKPSAH